MNILLCFNDKFVSLARILIISLMCHHEELHIYVGYFDLNEANRQGLKELVEGSLSGANLPWDNGDYAKKHAKRSIDFVHFDSKSLGSIVSSDVSRWSLDTWTRCFIWEQIPVDRLLYLDADMIVKANIEQFYYDDLQGKPLKACPDSTCYDNTFWKHRHIERFQQTHGFANGPSSPYVNAGVMLFDLKTMREEGDSAVKFLDFISKLKAPLEFNDQDFLNLYYDGRIKMGDPYKYNCMVPPLSQVPRRFLSPLKNVTFSEMPYPRSEADCPVSHQGTTYDPARIRIIHYSCVNKPHQAFYRHKFANIFWHYALMDPLDTSKHRWLQIFQNIYYYLRNLVPDYPKRTWYLLTNGAEIAKNNQLAANSVDVTDPDNN